MSLQLFLPSAKHAQDHAGSFSSSALPWIAVTLFVLVAGFEFVNLLDADRLQVPFMDNVIEWQTLSA